MKYGYARVSAEYQNEGRQLEALEPYVETIEFIPTRQAAKTLNVLNGNT